ncbi:MAG: MG2 domain-containing protein [Planctomycetota bacterium]|nr:MG2 domain-containing protein [Planctomycetota bacterium]
MRKRILLTLGGLVLSVLAFNLLPHDSKPTPDAESLVTEVRGLSDSIDTLRTSHRNHGVVSNACDCPLPWLSDSMRVAPRSDFDSSVFGLLRQTNKGVTEERAPERKRDSPDLEEQLIHRILIGDSETALTHSYGNSLLKVDRQHRELVHRWSNKAGKWINSLAQESRAYFPVLNLEDDLLWAARLKGAGFLQEAYFHYWMLERSLPIGDPRHGSIVKNRRECERLSLFFPKGALSEAERLDKKRIAFFMKEGEDGFVEIDARKYGVPKSAEVKFLLASVAIRDKEWKTARDLFVELKEILQPNSAAFYEASWQLIQLSQKLGGSEPNEAIELATQVLNMQPDVYCAQLTKEILSEDDSDDRDDEDKIPYDVKDTADDGEGIWNGRTFTAQSINTISEKTGHRPLPERSKYNYRKALQSKQRKILGHIQTLLPDLSKESADSWRILANQYIRIGDFEGAKHLFRRLETVTKESRDAFKNLACQIRQSFENRDRAEPVLLEALLQQFEIYHPGQFESSLTYFRGQIAFQAREWKRARELFATFLGTLESPERKATEFYCAILDRELLRLNVPKPLTDDGCIEVKVTLRNVRDIQFRFLKVTDAFSFNPKLKSDIKEQLQQFFAKQKTQALQCVAKKTHSLKWMKYAELYHEDIELKLPGEGLWLVEALAGSLKTSFVANQQSVKAIALQFPESSILVFKDGQKTPISQLQVYDIKGRLLGRTDSQGALVTPLRLDRNQTWEYHSSGSKCGKRAIEPIMSFYCSKPGQFFQTSVVLGEKVQANDFKRPKTRLYVYTDRPLYEAGDTIHFRAFIRKDSVPKRRQAKTRYSVSAGETVTVMIRRAGRIIYKKEFLSNEFGAFNGSFYFAKNAARTIYTLEVHYEKVVAKADIELRDLSKPRHSINFTETKTGLRIFAGYCEGLPVLGAEIECFIGRKLVPLTLDKDGLALLNLNPGDRVSIGLKLDGKVLAVKSCEYDPGKEHAAPNTATKAKKNKEPIKIEPEKKGKEIVKVMAGKDSSEFTLQLGKPLDGKSGTIDLILTSKSKKPWSAWIAMGDTAAFDFKRIESKGASKTVTIAVTKACDPCVYAHVLFEGAGVVEQERLRIPVRAALLQVTVETDKEIYEPGDSVYFDFWTKDRSGRGKIAEASLAVVDEALFSLKNDKTPDIYDFFYNDRGTDCHFESFRPLVFDSYDVFTQTDITAQHFTPVNVERQYYPLYRSLSGAFRRGSRSRWVGCDVARTRCGCGIGCGSRRIQFSLRWLARHQGDKGIWDNERYGKKCKGKDCQLVGSSALNVFSTALAIESFLNRGMSHRFGQYKRTVSKGLRALRRAQRADGAIGLEDDSDFAYLNHIVATLALCDAYRLTRDFKLKRPAQKALNFLSSRQLPGSGWGFSKKDKQANMLMTAWAVNALKAAELAGLNVPQDAFSGALSFVDSVTDSRGLSWFQKIGEEGPDYFGNKNQFVDYPEWTAMGLFVRLAAHQLRTDPVIGRGVEILRRARPKVELSKAGANFQYFYFSTRVMFQVGGQARADWISFVSNLVKSRKTKGCAAGTWSNKGRWGKLYGGIGSTALADWTCLDYERFQSGRRESIELPLVRLHFPETAYWNPRMRTRADGRFSGRLKLPDTKTTFRLTGCGISKDSDVGQVVKWIRVRKDFFVRLHCPSFLYQGDLCQVWAEVFDSQGKRQALELELSGEGFSCETDKLLSLTSIGSGCSQKVYWTLRARSLRELKVLIKARCGPLSDGMALTIPVRVFGKHRQSNVKRSLTASTEIEINVPKKAAPGSQSLRLVLRPENSVFSDILEALDCLVQLPSGSVEQTMSRFLPAVELGDSFKQLGLPIKSFVKRFDSVTQKGVRRLAGLQKVNGSWAWFASDAPNPFMTAYVVYGLSRARKAGVKLDETKIKRGCAYLKIVVKEQTNNDLKAFIYFALQSAGQGDLKEAKTLLEVPLSSYAKALLTLTLIRSGDRPAAEKLLRRLEKDRIDSGALSHFSTPRWFYKWENVSIETTAFAMLAFLEVKPNHEIVPKLKDWLLSKRQGKRWKTTKESSAAIFGLIKYFALTSKTRAKGKKVFQRVFKVTLNNEITRTVLIDGSNPLGSQLECLFDSSALKQGVNKIRVSGFFSKALGPVVCETTVSYVEAKRKLKGKENGLVVTCDWSRDPRELKVDDEVTILVNLTAKQDYNYLIVNVPIPAGAVVDRKSAKGVFAKFEARHDQGLFFLTNLKAGTRQLRFRFKCKFAGRYRVSGARGELMYSPDINGWDASAKAHILPKKPR